MLLESTPQPSTLTTLINQTAKFSMHATLRIHTRSAMILLAFPGSKGLIGAQGLVRRGMRNGNSSVSGSDVLFGKVPIYTQPTISQPWAERSSTGSLVPNFCVCVVSTKTVSQPSPCILAILSFCTLVVLYPQPLPFSFSFSFSTDL